MAAVEGEKRASVELVEDVTTSTESEQPETHKVSLWRSVRTYPRIVACCIALTTAILLYGYDLAIVGTVAAMPEFQHDFGRKLDDAWIIPSTWLALWNAASPIGIMGGAIAGGMFQDRFGRKLSLALGSILSAMAVAVCFVSNIPDDIDDRRGTFLAGKLFHGFAIGMVMSTAQTYMSEILPPKLRGPLLAFFPIFILLGQLAGAVVVFTSLDIPGQDSYRMPFLSQWPFSGVLLVASVVIPEAPAYLLRKNKIDAAFRATKRLHTKKVDPTTELERLRISVQVEQEQTSKASYVACFRGTDSRRTAIVAFCHLIPQLFGLSLLANASYFMQVVGMGANNSLLFLQLGIGLGLLANIASVWSLNVMGRRPLMLLTLAISAVLWLGMGIAGCFSGVVTIWWTAVTMMVTIIVCGIGVWPASYVVGGEASALHLRAKAQGVGWFVGGFSTGVFQIVLPYIFNPDQGNLRAMTGFIFAALCVIAAVVTWLSVPEMKGRTTTDIDTMFELKLNAKHFKQWSRDQT